MAGFLSGALAALSPDEQQLFGYRESRVLARLNEMERRLRRPANWPAFWGWPFVGGWPIPPEVPDPNTLWPEVDGWPVPPPHLRGASDAG